MTYLKLKWQMTKRINSKPPSPEKYALSGSEDAAQIAVMMWAALPENRQKYPELERLFAIPNGGFRTKSGAGKLKAMGVKSGVPDLFLPVVAGEWAGLWIEMKRPKGDKVRAGRTSEEQDDWIAYLKSQKIYGVAVCVGWEAARDTLISYLDYKNKAKFYNEKE